MGCLDPQLNKERTFELLRKRKAVLAELQFYGGHDEGQVERIKLTLEDGTTEQLEVWYCGGYTLGDDGIAGGWVPCSTAANEDEELSDLLQGPIDEQFGSWGGVDSTSGILVWNVRFETCQMSFTQDEPVNHERSVF